MLEWLTGSTRSADAQDARTGNEESYIEEPPETPAPLFAVRAFKTAIFGTPHPDQNDVKRHKQPLEPKDNVTKTRSTENVEGIDPRDAAKSHLDKSVAVPKVDPLTSPTKGILLTPGTGATRRKTVSFGALIADAQKQEEQSLSTEAKCGPKAESGEEPEVPKSSPIIQPRHSSLTKTLIQMSKQKSNDRAVSIESTEKVPNNEGALRINVQTQDPDHSLDHTVDLSQPRSRSGQHWKTEYEQYHKRSSREMKKMIMYGQNVKSYAVKKDSEATCLGEKLKKELAKVAAMEKKVSKLAAQLSNANSHGPEADSEQTRLVSELAQQTALAIRYKQKADHYRRLMQKKFHADGSDGEREEIQVMEEASQMSHREADSPEVVARSAEQDTLYAQMVTLRTSAKKAEDQVAKLEAENSALKLSLARVKGEMMSYEARRQAREERYKRREAKCKADQKACEAQLAKLTVEHQNLLLVSRQASNTKALAHPQPTGYSDRQRNNEGDAKSSGTVLTNGSKTVSEPLAQNLVSKPYISPRRNRLQRSTVDIWTLSSPRDAIESVSPSKEPIELPPSSVRHDIQRTLKEIDQNLIPEQHLGTGLQAEVHHPLQAKKSHEPPTDTVPQPQPQSNLTQNRKPIKPAMDNNAPTPNPAPFEPSEVMLKPTVKGSVATIGRSASLMSRAGSRTSTMTSVRGSALSAERAAAAKARLAARSVEKRKGTGK